MKMIKKYKDDDDDFENNDKEKDEEKNAEVKENDIETQRCKKKERKSFK